MKKTSLLALAAACLWTASASAQLTASVKQQKHAALHINTMDKTPEKKSIPAIRKRGPQFHRADLEGTQNSRISSVKTMEVNAFPNPFTNDLNVSVSDVSFSDSQYEAHVYTLQGKEVYAQRLGNMQNGLSLSSLSAGMYILQVHRNGSLVLQEKVVKE